MEIQLQRLVKSVVTGQNHGILIQQICEDEIMTSNELLDYVFDHLNEIQNEEKLTNLCQAMSNMYVKKRELTDIQKTYKKLTQADPFHNTKKKLIRTIVNRIGMKLFIICIVIPVIF